MNTIPQRIKHLTYSLKISVAAFEKNIGASNGTIATAITKDSNISGAILNKILIRYTELSPDWLITGTGPMLRSEIKGTGAQDAKDALIISLQQEKIVRLEQDLQNCKAEKKVSKDNPVDV